MEKGMKKKWASSGLGVIRELRKRETIHLLASINGPPPSSSEKLACPSFDCGFGPCGYFLFIFQAAAWRAVTPSDVVTIWVNILFFSSRVFTASKLPYIVAIQADIGISKRTRMPSRVEDCLSYSLSVLLLLSFCY
ncbi:hypothetical protein CDL15_Pgr017613 [Punica granatum]|uniref:Uncharacterized protein n=1 Tax=Punica granatum TaxID=22663 RepID=A0A218W5K3_PUNGR|nr:hypothetical protein CDL15_Pgr017613 [Punica granatum]